jgi:predicted short-subunit dehydrogenase-like oxidoreductase (DUF2520 family)
MPSTLAIVGAGRVGRALGRALRRRGWHVGAVCSRSRATAQAAVRAIGGGTAYASGHADALDADLILIGAPDRAIGDVAHELATVAAGLSRQGKRGAVQPPLRNHIVLHTSGAVDHAALAALARLGASTASMHPMQTFSRRGTPNLRGVVFGIEGDVRAVRVAQGIARSLGGVPVRIDSRHKVEYHTAGGFAAPHLLAVMEAGTRILMSAGLTRAQATRGLMNLARQTLDNVERIGPRAAWTGPLSRGDYETVARHVKTLRRFPPEIREAYNVLTRLGVALLAPQPRAMLRRLKKILKA